MDGIVENLFRSEIGRGIPGADKVGFFEAECLDFFFFKQIKVGPVHGQFFRTGTGGKAFLAHYPEVLPGINGIQNNSVSRHPGHIKEEAVGEKFNSCSVPVKGTAKDFGRDGERDLL